MKIKSIFIVLLTLCISLDVLAQHPQNLIKRKLDPDSPEGIALREIAEGDKTFGMKGLALGYALEHYLNAYNFDARNPVLNYKIGVCYLNTIYKVRSIPYLEKAYKIKPNVSRDIHYLLGLAYQLNLQWDDAIR